ncbi:MAG: CvpA family protein [Alphaproteobacteria bacterium]
MDFTVVDAGVAVVALLSGALAYARGFTREMFAIAGWAIAAVAAFYIAPVLEPLIREAPVVGTYLAASCVISLIAAFTIVVAIALLILSLFTPLVSGLVLDSMLAPIDRLLGFVFGVARGLVLIAVAFLIYTNLSGVEAWPPLDNAASRALFEQSAVILEQNLPDSVPDWFGARIDELMVNCSAELPAATSPEAGNVGTGTPTGTETPTGATGTDTTGAGTTGTGATGN